MSTIYNRIRQNTRFTPPESWLRIRTIDLHTGGEPLRVIVDGFPQPEGTHILEYRRYVQQYHDPLRRALMHEPRGHADMYGCLLLPPNDKTGDFSMLFLHNEGYSTMCGHAIIGITTLAVEMGWVERKEGEVHLRIDTPCGRIDSFARIERSHVRSVYFHGVHSFVVALDQEIQVPDLGTVAFDLVYGGAFYAIVDARRLGLPLTPDNYAQIIRQGMAIKKAIMASDIPIAHPFEEDLSFLYGTIFIGEPVSEDVDSRNVCIFAEGEVDRSPTGSGVSARMALHYARNEIKVGETMTIESIIGSVFKGSIVRVEPFGPFEAVIPQVEGTAHITGQHEFLIDPGDWFRYGFFLR